MPNQDRSQHSDEIYRLDSKSTVNMPNQKIIIFIAIMIIGYAIPIIPSSIDIGKMILMGIYNADLCQTEWCVEQQKIILNYYNLGGLIIGSVSLIALIQTLRNTSNS